MVIFIYLFFLYQSCQSIWAHLAWQTYSRGGKNIYIIVLETQTKPKVKQAMMRIYDHRIVTKLIKVQANMTIAQTNTHTLWPNIFCLRLCHSLRPLKWAACDAYAFICSFDYRLLQHTADWLTMITMKSNINCCSIDWRWIRSG